MGAITVIKMGLRGRATLLCTFLLLGTVGSLSAVLIWQDYRETVGEFTDYAVVHTESTGRNAAPSVLLNDRKALTHVVATAGSEAAVEQIQIIDTVGNVLAASQQRGQAMPPSTIDPADWTDRPARPDGARVVRKASTILVVAPIRPIVSEIKLDVIDDEEPSETAIGFIRMTYSMERILSRLWHRVVVSAFVSVIVIAVGIGGTILTIRQLLAPIHNLAETSSAIASGDLSRRASEKAVAEVGVLARAFNHMADCLQESYVSVEAKVTERTAQVEAQKKELEHEITERKRTERELQTAKEGAEAANRELITGNRKLQSEIAKRRRMEEALTVSNQQLRVSNDQLNLAVSQLEEVNRELKDFVYIASHDLREPLRKISSFGRLLEDSLSAALEADDRENLSFMIDGADRMTKMVEGLLTYSRLSRGETPSGVVDLNDVVAQLEQVELSELLAETGGVIDVPEHLPEVKGEPVQMRQLFQNLVANGLKYRRDGVAPRIVIRSEQTGNDMVKIEVRDNGIGIKEEFYRDIFTMFRRLHGRGKYSGVGIGLAVCKKIVERHGGEIGIESKLGEGSTFWFTLMQIRETTVISEENNVT